MVKFNKSDHFEHPENQNHDSSQEERPLDCGECKKPIKVHYTEIIGNSTVRTCMCDDCPYLEKHVHGKLQKKQSLLGSQDQDELCCKLCGTSLENIRMGHPVGCSQCYTIFGDAIIDEMRRANRISNEYKKKSDSSVLHIGRQLGETSELDPSSQLIALNEALNETLSREDYEQAAWLRDKIHEITSKKEEKSLKEGSETDERKN